MPSAVRIHPFPPAWDSSLCIAARSHATPPPENSHSIQSSYADAGIRTVGGRTQQMFFFRSSFVFRLSLVAATSSITQPVCAATRAVIPNPVPASFAGNAGEGSAFPFCSHTGHLAPVCAQLPAVLHKDMPDFAGPVERLIDELKHLPGIGQKTAQRLAFHLLRCAP